jgi:sugar-1,4-lactone oxidase-like protein
MESGMPEWTNWSETVRSHPAAIHHLETEEAVVDLVRRAAKDRARLKVAGSGHSSSPIAAADDGHLVSLDRYDRILTLDTDRKQVTVQAGMRLRDLNDGLAAQGLALSNMGSIAEQSVAGAISTGTHGTGLRFGALDQQLTRLTLITASGEVVSASPAENADLFAAARVGLGSLGILSTLTFQCEPSFNLESVTEPADLEAALAKLESFNQVEYFRLWWFPHTDKVQLWHARRTDRPADSLHGPLRTWYEDVLIGNLVHEAGLWLTSFVSPLIPTLNRTMRRCFHHAKEVRVDRSDRVFTFPILVKQAVMEYAIPIGLAATALLQLRDLIDQKQFKVHLPVEVRFAPANDAWLSMAHGRETCYIGLIMYRPFHRAVPYQDYFQQADGLLYELGGRPHWGKIHYRRGAELQSVYPCWERFQELRRRLDPEGMFMNAHLADLFGHEP